MQYPDTPPWSPAFKGNHAFETEKFNIIDHIRNNVVNNSESWDILLTGPKGDGKSTAAMSFAMMLDPDFTLQNWCFTSAKFIDLISSKHPPGTTIVFDDAGVSDASSSRRWASKGSHELADIIQMARTDRLIIIMTTIQASRIELRLRDSFKILAQPRRKLTSAQNGGRGLAVECNVRFREVDVFRNEVTYKYPRYASGGRVTSVIMKHPDKYTWHEYQLLRQARLDDVKAQMAATTKRSESIASTKRATLKELSKEFHIRYSDAGIYSRLFADMENTYGDTPDTAMLRDQLVDNITEGAGITSRTANNRVSEMLTYGALKSERVFDPAGKPIGHAVTLTDKGKEFARAHIKPGSE